MFLSAVYSHIHIHGLQDRELLACFLLMLRHFLLAFANAHLLIYICFLAAFVPSSLALHLLACLFVCLCIGLITHLLDYAFVNYSCLLICLLMFAYLYLLVC